MEYAQIQNFVMVLLALCAAVIAISGASAAFVKFWRFAHKQSDKNTEMLKGVETYLASDKRRIERLEENQETFRDENKLMLKALFTLLSHEIDGNHTDQLMAVRDEINTYLIEK